MAQMRPRLEAPVLIGVGAAFDFHAGLVPQAPALLQEAGPRVGLPAGAASRAGCGGAISATTRASSSPSARSSRAGGAPAGTEGPHIAPGDLCHDRTVSTAPGQPDIDPGTPSASVLIPTRARARLSRRDAGVDRAAGARGRRRGDRRSATARTRRPRQSPSATACGPVALPEPRGLNAARNAGVAAAAGDLVVLRR